MRKKAKQNILDRIVNRAWFFFCCAIGITYGTILVIIRDFWWVILIVLYIIFILP